MRPSPRSIMPPTTARVQRKAPVAFTSRCARQSSSVVRASGAPRRNTRVVDEHVDPADPLEERRHLLLVGDVEVSRPGAWTLVAGESSTIAFPIPFVPPVTTTSGSDTSAPRGRSCRRAVLGRSSTKRTSRGYLCGESARARNPGVRALRAARGGRRMRAAESDRSVGRRRPRTRPRPGGRRGSARSRPERPRCRRPSSDRRRGPGTRRSLRRRARRGRRCGPCRRGTCALSSRRRPSRERGRVAGDEQLAGLVDLGPRSPARARLCFRRAPGRAGSRCRCGTARRSRSRRAPRRRTCRASGREARRQRLTGGGAQAEAGQVLRGRIRMVDHLRHHRRNVDQDRRAVLGDQLEDPLRRRALGEDDPGGADTERIERGQVARVPEKELRDRQHEVVLADPEHAARVPVALSTGLCTGWTAPFGWPVLPVVNFQSATSSFVVGAGSSSSDSSSSRSGTPRRRREPAARLRPDGSPAPWSHRRQRPPHRCTRGSTRSPSAGGTCTPRR